MSKANEQGHNDGGKFIGVGGHIISDEDESISTNLTGDDYFRGLSGDSNRSCHSSETMDEFSNSKSMGRNYDGDEYGYDEVIPNNEEDYEAIIDKLGCAMAAKFVSGIHRYVYSI